MAAFVCFRSEGPRGNQGSNLSTMRFSIITCTRNSIATLAETIESVNRQAYRNFEHIFVDGGSTDGTLELIRSMSPGALVLHDKGAGISAAMNLGLRAAAGDVIAHLHSDDFYADRRSLEWVARVFSETNAGWVIGDFDYLTEHGRRTGSEVEPLTLRRLGYGNYIPHFSTFVRREWFLDAVGFDESLKYCMDYDLWFRLFARGKPEHVPGVLAVFRVHEGSVSSANRRKVLLEEAGVRCRHWNAVPSTLPRYLVRFMKRWHRNKLI